MEACSSNRAQLLSLPCYHAINLLCTAMAQDVNLLSLLNAVARLERLLRVEADPTLSLWGDPTMVTSAGRGN